MLLINPQITPSGRELMLLEGNRTRFLPSDALLSMTAEPRNKHYYWHRLELGQLAYQGSY